MPVTYGELSNFTWGELREMRLTFGDLEKLDYADLLSLAQKKLERFKQSPQEKQALWEPAMPMVEAIIAGTASNLLSDAIQNIDWKSLLIHVVNFLDHITNN